MRLYNHLTKPCLTSISIQQRKDKCLQWSFCFKDDWSNDVIIQRYFFIFGTIYICVEEIRKGQRYRQHLWLFSANFFNKADKRKLARFLLLTWY